MAGWFRVLLLITLHVLAFPARIAFWIIKSVRAIREYRAISLGTVRCRAGHVNELDILGRCRRCHLVSWGSRLYCAGCGLISRGFNCDTCQQTIIVFSSV